jgi:hypothetical protein
MLFHDHPTQAPTSLIKHDRTEKEKFFFLALSDIQSFTGGLWKTKRFLLFRDFYENKYLAVMEILKNKIFQFILFFSNHVIM